MNKKMSRAASVISILYNVLSVPFWGYFAFVMMIILDLGKSLNAEFTAAIPLLLAIIFLVASSIMAVVNFIMAIVSFKYVGKKSVKYDNGKKFIKAYIVLLFIQALFNISLAIVMSGSLIIILPIIIAVVSIVCAVLYLVDFIKNKKQQENQEYQELDK